MSIICQNCGTENPANARFCKQCGSRLSRVCANCGNPLAEDARFCNYCGAPVYGTGAFNAPADTVAAPVSPVFTAAAYAVQSQPAVRKNKDHTRVRRILQIILESFSLLAAAAAFIFVFLVGTAVKGSLENVGDSVISMASNDIYYYFGQAYKDIETALSQVEQYPGYLPTSLYVSTVFGTVTAAVMLIATVTLFAFTLVRFIRAIQGKTQKSALGLAAMTFFSFLAGALLFLAAQSACLTISVTQKGTTISGSAALVLNEATIAGICIGAVGLFASAACSVTENILRGGFNKSLCRRLFALAEIALAVVVLVFVTSGSVQFSITQGLSVQSELSIITGFGSILQLTGLYTADFSNGIVPLEYEQPLEYILGMSIAGFILQLLLSIAIVWALVNLFRTAADGRSRMLFLPVILTIAGALLVAIFGACVSGCFAENFASEFASSSLDVQILKPLTNVIVISVACAILLTLAIPNSILSANKPAKIPAAPYVGNGQVEPLSPSDLPHSAESMQPSSPAAPDSDQAAPNNATDLR